MLIHYIFLRKKWFWVPLRRFVGGQMGTHNLFTTVKDTDSTTQSFIPAFFFEKYFVYVFVNIFGTNIVVLCDLWWGFK